ncbi:MAG: ureidoglycolate lyase [Enhydrobacter sp.]
MNAQDYLSPEIPAGMRVFDVPLIRATRQSLKGFGEIVRDPKTHKVEIATWPAPGWRKLDPGTGNEGGTTEGIFACEWQGNELIGRNEAVGGPYVLGFRDPPDLVGQGAPPTLGRVLLWHCNYHPDGGQFFWPLDGKPFVVPVAPPGEDVKPEDFVAFWSDGGHGIYIHPNIWHEGPFPVGLSGRYFDKQGKVHARISCDIAREFGVLLGVPLPDAV